MRDYWLGALGASGCGKGFMVCGTGGR